MKVPCPFAFLRVTARRVREKRRKRRRGEDRKDKTEEVRPVFCNLIWGMTAHHICYILCVRMKLLHPAHTQMEGFTGSEHPEP